jgi:hypothetical protein
VIHRGRLLILLGSGQQNKALTSVNPLLAVSPRSSSAGFILVEGFLQSAQTVLIYSICVLYECL